jgi:hypothetical protein
MTEIFSPSAEKKEKTNQLPKAIILALGLFNTQVSNALDLSYDTTYEDPF